MASCEVCGDDLRRVCSQGHASRAGTLFCETCGEMLPLAVGGPAMAAAAPLTMDYSSGSFADFIEGGEDVPGPGGPATAVALAEPIPEPIPEAEPVRQPELVTEPEAHLAPEPEPEPEPEPSAPAPPALKPVPPAPRATVTEPKPVPSAPKPVPPAIAAPTAALPTLAPPAAAPQAANGGAAVTTTAPPDLRFPTPGDPPRTWRSSTKPRDKPG